MHRGRNLVPPHGVCTACDGESNDLRIDREQWPYGWKLNSLRMTASNAVGQAHPGVQALQKRVSAVCTQSDALTNHLRPDSYDRFTNGSLTLKHSLRIAVSDVYSGLVIVHEKDGRSDAQAANNWYMR